MKLTLLVLTLLLAVYQLGNIERVRKLNEWSAKELYRHHVDAESAYKHANDPKLALRGRVIRETGSRER